MTNRSDESDFSLDESLTKARKPYTITKQREKWTEDEHNKFLEALQLHSRNWRRIEEHIGTKTTIQIRSHAQKFFSKVTRESSNESIQIPPPRPKRKPAHPYPRKLGNTKPGKQIPASEKMEKRSSKDMVLGEEENSSPTSVLSSELLGSTSPLISAVGSNEADIGSMFSNDEPKLSSLMESEKQNDDDDEEEICAESGSPSVKLFGKTVISTGSNYENATRNTFETVEMDIESTIQPENTQNNYNISPPFLYYNYAPHYVLWNPYGNTSYDSYPLVKPEAVSPKVNSEEITNNLDNSQGLNSKISCNIGLGLRGFMPYKKRVIESEDGEIELNTRLCL